jgi:hypothetical protein
MKVGQGPNWGCSAKGEGKSEGECDGLTCSTHELFSFLVHSPTLSVISDYMPINI